MNAGTSVTGLGAISVNGGTFEQVPAVAFLFNPYNLTLQTAAAGNTNPLHGERAYSGTDGGSVFGSWGQTQIDLSKMGVEPGDTIRIRFDFGMDGCTGIDGWYVDLPTAQPVAGPIAAEPGGRKVALMSGQARMLEELPSEVSERLMALRSVWGTAALFILVIGGLYLGVFSPTEAASIGAVGALFLSLINRTFSWAMLGKSLMETVKTTAMIFTILIGAILFNNFLILAGLPALISAWMAGLPLGETAILLVILLMYLVLGCVLDSLAMVLLTIPIVFPIIQALGIDPIWFGILVVLVVELGLITPPIGMNVFVIKGIARDVPLESIFRGVLPFVIAQVILIAILIAFPQVALWLPSTMGR